MKRVAAVAIVSAAGVIGVALAQTNQLYPQQAQPQAPQVQPQAQEQQEQQPQQLAQSEPAQAPQQTPRWRSVFAGEPHAAITLWRSPFTAAPEEMPPSRVDEDAIHTQMAADGAAPFLQMFARLRGRIT